jgi:hypothetical protein
MTPQNEQEMRRLPPGYRLIRYGLFSWGWQTQYHTSLETRWTKGGAIKYAWKHNNLMPGLALNKEGV